MTIFIPYQVEYDVENAGKKFHFSKKKVVFKFGFANVNAVNEDRIGEACRGGEHELMFLWSLRTGKRQLVLDGKEIEYTETHRNGWLADRSWEHYFTLDDRTGTFRLHFISHPKSPDVPDSRPFDLKVAGASYFSFNKIADLGTPRMTVRDNGGTASQRQVYHYSGDPDDEEPMTAEERRMLAQAKAESMKEFEEQQKKSTGECIGASCGDQEPTLHESMPPPLAGNGNHPISTSPSNRVLT